MTMRAAMAMLASVGRPSSRKGKPRVGVRVRVRCRVRVRVRVPVRLGSGAGGCQAFYTFLR